MTSDIQRFVRQAMKRQGVTRAVLAERLGWYPSTLDRRLDQPCTSPKLNAIMDAIGLELKCGKAGLSVEVK